MEVNVSEHKNCVLIDAKGRIDSSTAPQLEETFNSLTGKGKYKLVFDMSEVDYISSAGLRVLISTQKTCKRYNRGQLVLASVPERVYDALDLAGFVHLFTIYDDVTTAVANV
jgi:anti-sigma B factor antagonist